MAHVIQGPSNKRCLLSLGCICGSLRWSNITFHDDVGNVMTSFFQWSDVCAIQLFTKYKHNNKKKMDGACYTRAIE
jgi:hypothetical protein